MQIERFLPNNIDIRFACSKGPTMVDKQQQFISRQTTNSATTKDDYSEGCIQKRLGEPSPIV